jgi:KDO2-lipid IV(A) lauroyltransferase
LSNVPQLDSRSKRKALARKLLAKFGDDLFVFAQNRFLAMSETRAERSGQRLGKLHYLLDSKHRNRTFSNLRMVFPDWSEKQIKETGREVFEHFGRVAGDFMRSPIRTNQEVLDSVVEVEGLENLRQAESMGDGIILITAHFGNWERFLQWLTASGIRISVVARNPNQQGLQERIIAIRERSGATVLARGDSARQSLLCLRRKEMLGLLADQNNQDAMVPFFGFPAGTVLGPAVMHMRTKAALLPAFCVWLGPGRYKVIFMPLVDPDTACEDRVQIMTELNLVLESIVRKYPSQYLWMHDRWKAARRAGLLPDFTVAKSS